MYHDIYYAPQPETQTSPQSNSDKPIITIEKSAIKSYIHDVVINDIKGEGYAGIKKYYLLMIH